MPLTRQRALGIVLLLLAAAYGVNAASANKTGAAALVALMFVPAVLLARTVWERDDRRAIILILALAVLVRVPMLAAAPLWSHDAFRYVWDGRLALRGIDPRAVTPLDPALADERTSPLWPAIDLRSIPTVYPPLAIGVFAIDALLDRNGAAGAKAIAGAADLGVIALLLWSLRRRGLPRGRVAIYALHPLVLVSFAQDGHIEAFAIAGIVAACFSIGAARVAALAGAILMKLYPAMLLPLFAARDRAAALATIAVVAVAYAPAVVTGHAFGSLPNYLTAQGFNASIALLGSPVAAIVFCAVLGIATLLAYRGAALEGTVLVVVAAYLLCTPNVLPWYLTVVPALVAAQRAPFAGRFGPLAAGALAWSATVSLAYAVPWLTPQGSTLDIALRIIEYAPLVAGALVTARRGGPAGFHSASA